MLVIATGMYLPLHVGLRCEVHGEDSVCSPSYPSSPPPPIPPPLPLPSPSPYPSSLYSELSVGAVEGFADDYSFLIRGLLDLFDITQDAQWAEWANQLQAMQLELFWDEAGGGLFSNTGVDPSVLLRLKEGEGWGGGSGER